MHIRVIEHKRQQQEYFHSSIYFYRGFFTTIRILMWVTRDRDNDRVQQVCVGLGLCDYTVYKTLRTPALSTTGWPSESRWNLWSLMDVTYYIHFNQCRWRGGDRLKKGCSSLETIETWIVGVFQTGYGRRTGFTLINNHMLSLLPITFDGLSLWIHWERETQTHT